jgi:anti-sigma factor RsiW
MSCQDYEAQIGDYVDGTMNEAQRAAFESHLVTCAPCQAVVADFTVIRAASLSLDARVPPPQVWQKIASAVEAEPRPLFAVPGARWWHSFAPAAAMAVLVVTLAWTAGQLTPIATERTRLARVSPAAGSELVTLAAEYQQAAQDLTTTIAGLERIAADDRSTLDMETRDVLDANLTVLDGAIGESRSALQQEPENDVAQESLFDALRHKVALLQDTIALINEMRKGNQEGAARIVSGLNQ